MSSNNVLYLIEQEDSKFKAYDWDADSDVWPSVQYEPNFEALTLRDAIQRAGEYLSRNIVEYGYQVVLREGSGR